MVVMAAAVADFRPAERSDVKIKKTDAAPAPIELTGNPDVLAELVSARAGGRLGTPVIVGFAAETGDRHADVLAHGRAKLARKGCDLLVVNAGPRAEAFGRRGQRRGDPRRRGTEIDIPLGPKAVLAAAMCDAVISLLPG